MGVKPVITNTMAEATHSSPKTGVEEKLSTESAYPLELNRLEHLVDFVQTPAGLCVVSKVDLPAGAHFAYITSHGPQPSPSWKTIQTSATTHTDPMSALLYMNHSCQPSLEVHTYPPNAEGVYPKSPPSDDHIPDGVTENGLAGEVKVSRDRGIAKGDALTFFYPSTEWKFDRAFKCLCGAPEEVCVGNVQGAAFIEEQDLRKWFFNKHILELAEKRDAEKA